MKLEIASRADILLLVFISAIAPPDSKMRSPVFKDNKSTFDLVEFILSKVKVNWDIKPYLRAVIALQ